MSRMSCMFKYAVYKVQQAPRLSEQRVSQTGNTCHKYAMHVCCCKGNLTKTPSAQLRQFCLLVALCVCVT